MRILALILIGLIARSAPAAAIDAPPSAPAAANVPAELEGIDLVDRSGNLVPLDVALVNEAGEAVRLGDYFGTGKPVLIQLVYYSCPMLCTLVLNGYVDAAKPLDWSPGTDYTVVTVSFDPKDTSKLAADKKKNYVDSLEKPGAGEGWHFLVGEEAEVRRLADALGFGYRYMPERKEFVHAAGMFVLTPEGKISRTLYGIEYPSQDLKLSLLEAAEGRLGSPVDKLILYCFRYDPETQKYALVAINVMKLGGLLTIVVLGAFLGVHWTRERRRAAHAAT
jgi:protein SCO1/2